MLTKVGYLSLNRRMACFLAVNMSFFVKSLQEFFDMTKIIIKLALTSTFSVNTHINLLVDMKRL